MNASVADRKKRRNLQSASQAKIHQLYSGDDVIKLYGISRNTLTNWIGGGCLSSKVSRGCFSDQT